MGTRAQAYALAKVINIPYNASNGYFVIGMDVLDDPSQGLTPSNLLPAVGTSATISEIYSSPPVIFAPRPQEGNSVVAHGSSFVTWADVIPNMDTPGSGIVSIQPADGQKCVLSPGFTTQDSAEPIVAFPDSVTVVCYICSNL